MLALKLMSSPYPYITSYQVKTLAIIIPIAKKSFISGIPSNIFTANVYTIWYTGEPLYSNQQGVQIDILQCQWTEMGKPMITVKHTVLPRVMLNSKTQGLYALVGVPH